jgi:hypothetical protein
LKESRDRAGAGVEDIDAQNHSHLHFLQITKQTFCKGQSSSAAALF